MSKVRSLVARVERHLARRGGTPFAVQIALARMWARDELFDETCIEAANLLDEQLAQQEGRPAAPRRPDPAQARRFERARQVLGIEDLRRHKADQQVILRWERRREGRPGRHAERWGGNWEKRRFQKILDEIDAEFRREHGISDRPPAK